MDPTDVAGLLAYASALDPRVRRTEPEQRQAQVVAWSTVLHDVDLAAAREAVARHYSRPGVDAVLPGDVCSGARGSETDRHPAYRPLRESIAEADAAAGGSPMRALPPGPQDRGAVVAAKAQLDEAVAKISAGWAAPAVTGYVQRRQRGPVHRGASRRLPTTDGQGRPLTVCHGCVGDMPAPDGWDPADKTAERLYCASCTAAGVGQ